jgi:dihydropteroate synthase
MSELTATALKSALWDTLNDVRSGKMQPAEADSVATQAREILRATNTQLRISSQSKRAVPADLISFSEK